MALGEDVSSYHRPCVVTFSVHASFTRPACLWGRSVTHAEAHTFKFVDASVSLFFLLFSLRLIFCFLLVVFMTRPDDARENELRSG